MSDITFIVDSAASFPKEWYEENGLHVVRLGLKFPNEDPIAEFDITPEEFYAKLRKSKELPVTSAANPYELSRIYDEALSNSEHAIMLTLTKKTSGTNTAAESVASQPPYKGKVTVIDTNTVGPAQGFIALEAKRFSKLHTLEEVISHVKVLKQNAKVYLVPETLEYLHKGGRINNIENFIGSLLKTLPVISVRESKKDGSYYALGISKHRTMNKSVNVMLDYVREDAETAVSKGLSTVDIMVIHSDNEDLARGVVVPVTLQRLAEAGLKLGIQPTEKAPAVYITPVLGTHTGPGSVGVATLYRK